LKPAIFEASSMLFFLLTVLQDESETTAIFGSLPTMDL
jgi:hypothetical protein